MKAYLYDNLPGDQRLPHDSGQSVGLDDLEKVGVLYHQIDEISGVDILAKQRGYKNRDQIVVSPENLGESYESKVQSFFAEHLHEDEEIRYVLDGSGFFDVRNKTDDWIRIYLTKGDLIILPAGIYHRFTTDETNFITALRLFKDEPQWAPLNRSTDLDHNPFRQDYEQKFLS